MCKPRIFLFSAALTAAFIFFTGCSDQTIDSLPRQDLFSLNIGKLEDQFDLFNIGGNVRQHKNDIVMNDGIIYLSNGGSGKVMIFNSYGDLIGLFYNPETNPVPVLLQKSEGEERITNRKAFAYPFRNVGVIEVTENRDLLVEDVLPEERTVEDEELGVTLNRIILRFDSNGNRLDYLGQEGVRGTPFPYIQRIDTVKNDEIVVTCRTEDMWIVYWFTPEGENLARVDIDTSVLPIPEEGHIPVLESIYPDPHQNMIYLKLNYYTEQVDPDTSMVFGIKNSLSRIYRIDLDTGIYQGFIPVPENVQTREIPGTLETREINFFFELIGVSSGPNFFLACREETDTYQLIILNSKGKVIRRRYLTIEDKSLLERSFHVSPSGIITALLGWEEEVKVVWWRSDTFIKTAE
ncbi:MAG: LIC_12708 family protein [Spirochaetia bacterium]